MAVANSTALASMVTTASQLGAAKSAKPEAVLPVCEPLGELLPWPGLRRGTVISVRSVAVLLALVSEASANGSWTAAVGLPGLGVEGAAETGIDITRLALVPQPGGEDLARVIAALMDGVDLVAVGHPEAMRDSDARRLSARVRERGTVLLPVGSWPHADLTLECSDARWHGIGDGHGRLQVRSVTVHAHGRGAAAQPRSRRLLLPGPTGAPQAIDELPSQQRDTATA